MNCIVNVAPNWGIGVQDRLLVSIPADLKRFRSLTTGKTVILGRKTLATFPGGRPLKNRRNLVLSHDPTLEIDGAEVLHSLDELLSRCREIPRNELCVIGGEQIYRLLLPYCDTAEVTRSEISATANRFFPNLDETPGWHLTAESEAMEENGIVFRYLTYQNSTPLQF